MYYFALLWWWTFLKKNKYGVYLFLLWFSLFNNSRTQSVRIVEILVAFFAWSVYIYSLKLMCVFSVWSQRKLFARLSFRNCVLFYFQIRFVCHRGINSSRSLPETRGETRLYQSKAGAMGKRPRREYPEGNLLHVVWSSREHVWYSMDEHADDGLWPVRLEENFTPSERRSSFTPPHPLTKNCFKIWSCILQCVPIKRKPVLSVRYLHYHARFIQTKQYTKSKFPLKQVFVISKPGTWTN